MTKNLTTKNMDFRIKETKAYRELKSGYTNHIQYYLNHHPEVKPYLTTFRFKNIPLNYSYCPYQYKFLTNLTWKFYHRVYFHLSSSLTNNITRKPHLFPLTYDFLDIDHTDKSLSVTFTETTIPHIHSIYLVHESLLGRFHQHIDTDFSSIIHHSRFADHIRTIDSRPITDDLPFTVSYASKFYDNYQARIIRDKEQYEFYNQLPLVPNDLRILASERTDKSLSMITETQNALRIHFNNS
jgi:hypothetical protein